MLLDSGASHNFIAVPQTIKLSKSIHKSLLCPINPIEVHLVENSTVISHKIVHLPLTIADSAYFTIELWVFPVLSHSIILIMLFLDKLNPSIYFKNHIIIESTPNFPLLHITLFL